MDLPELHRLRREDFDAVIRTLTECFFEDPLYKVLIPERAQRSEILPEVFDCDANELVQYCDLYSESPDVNGLIMLEDPAERKGVRKYLAERYFAYLTEQRLLEDDESGEIAEHFRKAKDFLSSDWVGKVGPNTIHIVYFAVRKAFHGKGLAHKLISPVLAYADKNGVTGTYTVEKNEIIIKINGQTFAFVVRNVVKCKNIICKSTTLSSDDIGYFKIDTVFEAK